MGYQYKHTGENMKTQGFNCRTISKAVLARFPELSKFEFVRGNGYFYVHEIELKSDPRAFIEVDSVYVNALNHCSLRWWVLTVTDNVRRALASKGVQS
jgi:hypothetical protein